MCVLFLRVSEFITFSEAIMAASYICFFPGLQFFISLHLYLKFAFL